MNGGALADDDELLGRVGHLLGIHKALRILYPKNRDLVYRWVNKQHLGFDGAPPLEIMKSGYEGIAAVFQYLELELGR